MAVGLLALTAPWTYVVLGAPGMRKEALQLGSVVFACFAMSFWLYDLALWLLALWTWRGTTSVQITVEEMVVCRTCLGFRSTRRYPLPQVQKALPPRKHAPSAEIIYVADSLELEVPTKKEGAWLADQINDFLNEVRGETKTSPRPGSRGCTAERPFNARAEVVTRTENELAVRIPSVGCGVELLSLLCFTTSLVAFAAFATLEALGYIPMRWAPGTGILWVYWHVGAWLSPIPSVMIAAWLIAGKCSVRMNRKEKALMVQWRCLSFRRTRHIDLRQIQVRPSAESLGTEVIYPGGSFTLATGSVEEEAWLTAELSAFLGTIGVRQPTS
jgi:hypothetical protein